MEKITCTGITKEYPGEVRITYNDIEFEKGHSYLILGGSGCGKSTLLNMIAGVLSASTGKIIYESDEKSIDLTALSMKERDKFRIMNIGYIYQDFKLIDEMTVEDNLDVLRLETTNLSDMDECLQTLGILDKKKSKVKNLSGGQKQRVAIARAMLKNPLIMLADEPTGNLNAEVGRQMVKELTELSKDKFLIVVSHDETLIPFFTDVVRLDSIAKSELLK